MSLVRAELTHLHEPSDLSLVMESGRLCGWTCTRWRTDWLRHASCGESCSRGDPRNNHANSKPVWNAFNHGRDNGMCCVWRKLSQHRLCKRRRGWRCGQGERRRWRVHDACVLSVLVTSQMIYTRGTRLSRRCHRVVPEMLAVVFRPEAILPGPKVRRRRNECDCKISSFHWAYQRGRAR